MCWNYKFPNWPFTFYSPAQINDCSYQNILTRPIWPVLISHITSKVWLSHRLLLASTAVKRITTLLRPPTPPGYGCCYLTLMNVIWSLILCCRNKWKKWQCKKNYTMSKRLKKVGNRTWAKLNAQSTLQINRVEQVLFLDWTHPALITGVHTGSEMCSRLLKHILFIFIQINGTLLK